MIYLLENIGKGTIGSGGSLTITADDVKKLEAGITEVDITSTSRQYRNQQNILQEELDDAATLIWDLDDKQSAKLVATSGVGNTRTLPNSVLTNAVNGGTYQLNFIQDGVGGRTLAFDTNYEVVGEIDLRPNKVTVITIVYEEGIGHVVLSSFEGVVGGGGATDKHTVYVDDANGDDGTAEVGNSTLPYATIQAAINAINGQVPSDVYKRVILVTPGAYGGWSSLPIGYWEIYSLADVTLTDDTDGCVMTGTSVNSAVKIYMPNGRLEFNSTTPAGSFDCGHLDLVIDTIDLDYTINTATTRLNIMTYTGAGSISMSGGDAFIKIMNLDVSPEVGTTSLDVNASRCDIIIKTLTKRTAGKAIYYDTGILEIGDISAFTSGGNTVAIELGSYSTIRFVNSLLYSNNSAEPPKIQINGFDVLVTGVIREQRQRNFPLFEIVNYNVIFDNFSILAGDNQGDFASDAPLMNVTTSSPITVKDCVIKDCVGPVFDITGGTADIYFYGTNILHAINTYSGDIITGTTSTFIRVVGSTYVESSVDADISVFNDNSNYTLL